MKPLKTKDSRLKTQIRIKSEELLADIRSAAWLEQELHPELDRHRRHQMADICEKDSEERVWRVLGLTVAEIRHGLGRILRRDNEPVMTDDLTKPEEWLFGFLFPLPPTSVDFLREKIHETLVASVMAERTEVIIPTASPIWRERAVTALAEIRLLAATARPPFARVRRPVWPG